MFLVSTLALEISSMPITEIKMKNIKVQNLLNNFFNGFQNMIDRLEKHTYEFTKVETRAF